MLELTHFCLLNIYLLTILLDSGDVTVNKMGSATLMLVNYWRKEILSLYNYLEMIVIIRPVNGNYRCFGSILQESVT